MTAPFIQQLEPGGSAAFPPKMTWRQALTHQVNWWRWRYDVWCGYYGEQGEPYRCKQCDSWHWTDHKETTIDRLDYTPCEVEISCKRCGNIMGYWAYGHYEPPYI